MSTTPTIPAAAADSDPQSVLACDACRGMLLAHVTEGENVGVEIRHVEPSEDDTKILVVTAGGGTAWFGADEPLQLVTRKESEAAQSRLFARRRRTKQVAILRQIADLIEAHDLQWPGNLSVSGGMGSVEDLAAAAELFGVEVSVDGRGGDVYRRVECLFGEERRYMAGVELTLSHVEHEAKGVAR